MRKLFLVGHSCNVLIKVDLEFVVNIVLLLLEKFRGVEHHAFNHVLLQAVIELLTCLLIANSLVSPANIPKSGHRLLFLSYSQVFVLRQALERCIEDQLSFFRPELMNVQTVANFDLIDLLVFLTLQEGVDPSHLDESLP